MDIEGLKKLGSRINAKQSKPAWSEYPMGTKFSHEKPRWKETGTPSERHITFNKDNFTRNVTNIRGKLKDFGDKHPNLRDPSFLINSKQFDILGAGSQPQHRTQKKPTKKHGQSVHVYHHYGPKKKKRTQTRSSDNMFDFRF